MVNSILYEGETLRVEALPDRFAELCFDRQGGSVNKFDRKTVAELLQAIGVIERSPGLRGVLITSGKAEFIVGADIHEFGETFALPHADLLNYLARSNDVFIRFESLELPTVAAIDGFALGGGLEFTLAAGYRVMATGARVGLPEVGLGLLPGFGGTVRLPRLVGLAAAMEWIALGKPHTAAASLADGVADAVCSAESLREQALAMLHAVADSGQWRERRQRKREPAALPDAGLHATIELGLARYAQDAPRQQPAARAGIELLGRAAAMSGAQAQLAESETFAVLAKSQAAVSLVQMFVNEQMVRKLGHGHARGAAPVARLAVVAAGSEGAFIADASAARGMAVRLMDIPAMQPGQADYAGFDEFDFVVEAVADSLEAKLVVLGEIEAAVPARAVLATSTSCLRMADIAAPLARPENLVGLHFCTTPPSASLVEIVRGPRTSSSTVARAAAYVAGLGRTPLVVMDGPGFLVNRVLAAYTRAFLQLLTEGADFDQVDLAMEASGWPMGPAQLLDATGLDTGWQISRMIASAYPDRVPPQDIDVLHRMVKAGRLGRKYGSGFYRYESSTGAPLRRAPDPRAAVLVASLRQCGPRNFDEQEIVDRLMLPLVVEAARALEDGVVATPAEVDVAMVLGLGFPRHLGGPLKYADWCGLQSLAALSQRYAVLGQAWQLTPAMQEMARAGIGFYQNG